MYVCNCIYCVLYLLHLQVSLIKAVTGKSTSGGNASWEATKHAGIGHPGVIPGHPGVIPGHHRAYHVEGDVNAAYSQMVINQICQPP
jgi:hypothetical protein